MGSVWVAFHHRLQTRVAVKFVSDKLGEHTAEALARFEREAATAAQIKSPHVVQTFDSGLTPEGIPYMVMELLEGESLGDRLRREGRLGLHDAAIVLTHVARALTKAHQQGIIHRDIKPDNIYLCHSVEGIFCKVLDFGIAKQTRLPQMGGLTHEGKMVGTPEYLSPEQVLEGHPADYRADLWALAIVMYVSLTGYLPFTGKTVGQMCLALASGKHRLPSELNRALPPSLDEWFAGALHRTPDVRPASAREMAQTFLAALPAADAVGVDVGGPTFMTQRSEPVLSMEETERQFGSVANTVPPAALGGWQSRIPTPITAAAAALGVIAVGASVFVLSSEPSGDAVAPPLTPIAPAAEADAPAEVEAPGDDADEGEASPAEVVDLDETEAQPSARPVAMTRPRVAQPPAPKTPPDPEPAQVETAKPAPPPPPATTGKKRRDKEELGF